MHRTAIALLPLLLLSLASATAFAQWSSTGNVAADDAVTEQLDDGATPPLGTAVCTDGQNGLIVAWIALAPGADEVRANRLDGVTGGRLWGVPNGVLANTGYVAGGGPQVESDRAGGAWVAWADDRPGAGGIYVQRFDAGGVAQLTAGGIRIGDVPAAFDLSLTTSGKLLLAIGFPSGSATPGVYVQRLSLTGARELTASGRKMSNDTGASVLQIFGDGQGGVLTWNSARAALPGPAGETRVVANRFDQFGSPAWGADGAVVQAGAGVSAIDHRSAWDGTSLFVAWMDAGTDSTVRAQRLDGTGAAQWGSTASGIAVVDFAPTPYMSAGASGATLVRPRVVADGLGGCVVAWIDGRDHTRAGSGAGVGTHGLDVYAQRLTATGVAQWASGGAAADSLRGDARDLLLCTDADHGAYLAFRHQENFGSGAEENVRLARLGFDGSVRWSLRPHAPSPMTDGAQSQLHVAPDDLGGVVAAWRDARLGGQDLYATHRTANALLACDPLLAQAPVAGADGPSDVIAADFNEDGILDLAAATANSGVLVYPGGGSSGTGDGTFGAPSAIALPSSGLGLATGDFDADGILDLAVTLSITGVQVHRGLGAGGLGDGTFGAGTVYAAGSGARGVVVGDFDEDGILDLVAANISSDNVTVRLGNGSDGDGDGTFGAAVHYAAGDAPLRLLVEDFNEDGIWDLAVTNNSGASSVSVLLGNGAGAKGDGTFGAPTPYTAGNTPSFFAAGDFDEDGITDLAAGYLSGIAILRGAGAGGIGNGGFLAPVLYAIGAGAGRAIAVAEVNDDGRPDLVVTEPGQDRLHVMLGSGAGTDGNGAFTKALTRAAGDVPNAIVAGDFVEDGAADVVTANTNSDNFSVLAGACAITGNGALTIADPSPGATGVIGQEMLLSWTKGEGVHAVDVEVSRDGGVSWQTIAPRRTATVFAWTVTPPASANARARVKDSLVAGRSSTSGAFTITASPVAASLGPAAFALSLPWPSPARGDVRITLAAGRESDVVVEALDIRGRIVETVHRGRVAAGAHSFVWSGRGGVAPGLYFLRARWDGGAATRRVVRLD
jgi:hypothetical protein